MSEEKARTNRLGDSSSPYLLLHRHNPVDWYPWGPEALERAREEDRPIFLSVGYSTCYWCHVMERESFSNPVIADLMNREFVNVKVDREERPDLDEIYMAATQIYAGQGGWPNSLFLTPKLEPFFAGTYFPPDDRWGRPGFARVLASLAEAWKRRRSEVEEQAESLVGGMRRFLEEKGEPAPTAPAPEAALRSLEALRERYDSRNGGFSGAPKFPTPSNLHLLLELGDEEPRAAEMLSATLAAMADGGIRDHLAGGFHRYSTDAEWRVPHFEKMLYDNGLLLEVYALQAERVGDAEAGRVAAGIVSFLAAEMTSPEGAFVSAIDAETDGFEGAYYVWTREQLAAALGEEEFGFAAPLLGFDGPPFFEGDHYVLHRPRPLAELAGRRRLDAEQLLEQLEPVRRRLLEVRSERRRPLTDDKILADWNGTAIAGLAVAGRCLGRPEWVERAATAAGFLLETLRLPDGTLLHSWRGGEGTVPAFLADYAFLVRGLLALHDATGEQRWLESAVALAEEQDRRLAAPNGGWYAAAEADDLLFRSQEVFDGAVPAANGVAVLNALRLAEATGEARWREGAERALRAFAVVVEHQPDGARTLALAARRLAAGAPGATKARAVPDAPRDAPADPLADEARAVVRTRAMVGDADADGLRPLTLELEIAAGWHLTPHGAEGVGAGVELVAEGHELRDVEWPPGREVSPAGGRLRIYDGRTVVRGRLRPATRGRLTLRHQPCDDRRCLPAVEVEVPLPAMS